MAPPPWACRPQRSLTLVKHINRRPASGPSPRLAPFVGAYHPRHLEMPGHSLTPHSAHRGISRTADPRARDRGFRFLPLSSHRSLCAVVRPVVPWRLPPPCPHVIWRAVPGNPFAGAQGRLFSDGQLGVGRRRALQDDRGTGGPSPGSATPWGAPPRSREVVQNRVLAVCCSEEQCRRDSRPPLSISWRRC